MLFPCKCNLQTIISIFVIIFTSCEAAWSCEGVGKKESEGNLCLLANVSFIILSFVVTVTLIRQIKIKRFRKIILKKIEKYFLKMDILKMIFPKFSFFSKKTEPRTTTHYLAFRNGFSMLILVQQIGQEVVTTTT